MSLFEELKRRNVFRVVAAYVVMSWLLLQVADVVLEAFEVPDWTSRFLILALAIGLVPVAVFSWIFEMTPEGIKKESEVDRDHSVTHSTGRRLNYLTIAMVVAGVIFVLYQSQTEPVPAAPEPAVAQVESATTTPPAASPADAAVSRSIAVLPFVNMSADPENEYFADGLSEELLNQLAQLPDLQVAGRTSSFSFKGKNEDLRKIGATLGVANVLEGSVRRQGEQVRVTAQLIRVGDGFHLWSNTYDRKMDDVFAIQDDISTSVASALKIVLDESARQRMQQAGVRNVDAFVEYQKGAELFAHAHGGEDMMALLREGVVHFDRAIELVPEFGAAYWSKSDYYAHVILDSDSSGEQRAAALADLQYVLDQAYRFSADSPRRAFIDVDRVLFSDDWTPLHDRINKALASEGCPTPTWIELAIGIGYAEDSRKMWNRYQQCEPLDQIGTLKFAQTYAYQGDFKTAGELLDESEVQFGSNAWTAASRQWFLNAEGRHEEALALAPMAEKDTSFFGMSARTLPLAAMGDAEGAMAAMANWKNLHGPNLRAEIEIHAALGQRQQANELAAEMDALPGGSMQLLLTAMYCGCGAPFDLEATPNFRDRLKESGTQWPLATIIQYPLKDW